MKVLNTTRATLLTMAVATVGMMPMAAAADGHTNAYIGNKGYVGDAQPRPVTHQSYHGGKYRGHRRAGGHLRVGAGDTICPPKFYGQFRGTLYCQNGKLMPLH